MPRGLGGVEDVGELALAVARPEPQSAGVLRCLEGREGDASLGRIAEARGGEEDDADVRRGGLGGWVEHGREEFPHDMRVREVVGAELDLAAVAGEVWRKGYDVGVAHENIEA